MIERSRLERTQLRRYNNPMEILSVNELQAMSESVGQLDQAAIVVDTTTIDGELDVPDQWLLSQKLPTIAIADAGSSQSALSAFDLVVTDRDAASTMLEHIAAHPQASAVLVSVVRMSLESSIQEALTAESLGYSTLQQGDDYQSWLAGRPAPRLSNIESPLLVQREDDELNITLNSPKNRNAVSVAMRDALAEIFQLVLIDDTIDTAHIRGNGPDFCAGGDLKEFGLSKDPATAHQVRMQIMPGQFVASVPDRFHFHLHGSCVGAGIEMPAFAHRVSATADASFRLPEVGFGLIPGAGGCVSIPRRIGKHRMNWLAITGETIDVATALDWGLIDEIESDQVTKEQRS